MSLKWTVVPQIEIIEQRQRGERQMDQLSLSAISHPNYNSSEWNKVGRKREKYLWNMPQNKAQSRARAIFLSYSKHAIHWSGPAN